MSKKGFAKLVIAVGVLIMIIGMNMDVTVGYGSGRVTNIHLISQKQTLMMLGGFIFLGGLILFGVARMKQTPEEEAKEETESEEAAEARRKKAGEIVQQGAEAATQQLNALRGNWGQLAKRLFAGFIVGLLAGAIYDHIARLSLNMGEIAQAVLYDYKDMVEIAVIVGVTIYVARHASYLRVVKMAFALEAAIFGLFLAIALVASILLPLKEGVVSGIAFYFVVTLIAFFISARSVSKQIAGNT